jgi:hypothetical protein
MVITGRAHCYTFCIRIGYVDIQSEDSIHVNEQSSG